MAKFYSIPISFLLVAVCIILVYSWAVGTAENYGYDSSFVNDEKANFSKLEQTVNEINEDSAKWEEKFRSDNLIIKYGSIVLFSLFGIIDLIWVGVVDVWNNITEMIFNIFGIPPIMIATLTAILIITLIFLAYESLQGGSS